MIKSDFKGIELPALGLGLMRLPILEENFEKIDVEKTKEMVAFAMENGVNYFDTAYGYHGGNSEIIAGSILSEYPRDSYLLVSKFPGYAPENFRKKEDIFEEQLLRCRTDYFDFYLLHNVYEDSVDGYMDKKLGLIDYLLEQKRAGRIRHLGFSVHAEYPAFKRFLMECGEHMEFCMVELNWLDWDYQDAKDKVRLLNELGIPIWVMEPVRGGKLAKLSDVHMDILKAADPGRSSVEWCFRYIQSIPGVRLVLSGMSSIEQIEENIGYFQEIKPLSEKERDILHGIGKSMVRHKSLQCTECGYCLSYCPNKLNIPELIDLYNKAGLRDRLPETAEKVMELSILKRPSACIGCGSCDEVCPQKIKISEAMKDFKKLLRGE